MGAHHEVQGGGERTGGAGPRARRNAGNLGLQEKQVYEEEDNSLLQAARSSACGMPMPSPGRRPHWPMPSRDRRQRNTTERSEATMKLNTEQAFAEEQHLDRAAAGTGGSLADGEG